MDADIISQYSDVITGGLTTKGNYNSALKDFSSDTNAAYIKVMFYKDEDTPYVSFVATGYEPYVGGIPSPNPDYPQEIEAVVNPVVKVCGKNLLDAPREIMVKESCYPLKSPILKNIVPSGTYVFSFDSNEIKGAFAFAVFYEDGARDDIISAIDIARNNTVTITFNKNVKEIEFYINIPSTSTITITNIMMRLVNTSGEYEPYTEHLATLPYTLNAIPVSSGGNVTIDGQEYIADYVDVERGKRVICVGEVIFDGSDDEGWNKNNTNDNNYLHWILFQHEKSRIFCDKLKYYNDNASTINNDNSIEHLGIDDTSSGNYLYINIGYYMSENTLSHFKSCLQSNPIKVYYQLKTPIEIDLTGEEVQMFRDLATHYPTTNIFVTSDQLDGYTEFNYPVSLAEGWNYVKQQLGDTRDYIYDMDLQSAEAYVNSEYAVSLAELEV